MTVMWGSQWGQLGKVLVHVESNLTHTHMCTRTHSSHSCGNRANRPHGLLQGPLVSS